MKFLGYKEIMKPTEIEATLLKIREELPELPESFKRRLNERVFELKYHNHSAYSLVESEVEIGNVYVVRFKGIIYIAGSMIDSRKLITFGDHQYPAIEIDQICQN